MMDNGKASDILLQIAEGGTYESEYNGFCHTYCCYCNANLSHKDVHEKDCVMLKSRELMKDEMARLKTKRQKYEKEAYKNTWKYKTDRISCPNCGKSVKRVGLENHIRDAGCSKNKARPEVANEHI